jgi:putative addiction module killer protein
MFTRIELRRYKTPSGQVPFSVWLEGRDNVTGARVRAHVDRMRTGNLARSRQVGRGVSELKIDFGPGYRIYYLRDGDAVVVLLCAGDKGSQQADIQRAHEYAADYWRRR